MSKILYNLKLKYIAFSNQIYLYTHKFNQELTILSCNKWQNKVKEDLILQKYLLKNGIKTTIISWEKSKPSTKYTLIRSIWVYQDKINAFNNYLLSIKNNTNLINSYEIITSNIDKQKEFNILSKYQIPHINTTFYNDLSSLKPNLKNNLVVKPIISASGNHTYLIKDNQESILNDLSSLKCGFMLQEFIPEIKNGEYSIIVFGNQISHAVIRYPGILSTAKKTEYIPLDQLDKQLINLVNQIIKIPEFQDNTYIRIDTVKTNNQYLVMEIELTEPQLFLEWIPNPPLKKEAYQKFINIIQNKIKPQQ